MNATIARRIALMAAFTLLAFVFAVLPGRADAVWREGCGASTQYRIDWWQRTQTTSVPTLDPFDSLWRSAKMRWRAGMGYWFCPRGNRPDKIMFDAIHFEGTKMDHNELPSARGAKFNTYMATTYNGGLVNNPPGQRLKWQLLAGNKGDRKVKFQNFKNDGWWLRRTVPFWTMSAWVDLQLLPDDHIDFKGLHGGKHYLGYENDEIWIH